MEIPETATRYRLLRSPTPQEADFDSYARQRGSPNPRLRRTACEATRNIPDDQSPGSQKPPGQPLQPGPEMAGHRSCDHTAGSGPAESCGTQRTPDLVAKQGIRPIGRVQGGRMKITQAETLLLYDCELLFQAQDPQGQTYMVSHTGECRGECEYVAVPVDRRSLSEYRAGRIDLRKLMLTGGREAWYVAKATGNPGELSLERQKTPFSESPELPMRGFHHDPKFSERTES